MDNIQEPDLSIVTNAGVSPDILELLRKNNVNTIVTDKSFNVNNFESTFNPKQKELSHRWSFLIPPFFDSFN